MRPKEMLYAVPAPSVRMSHVCMPLGTTEWAKHSRKENNSSVREVMFSKRCLQRNHGVEEEMSYIWDVSMRMALTLWMKAFHVRFKGDYNKTGCEQTAMTQQYES